MIYKRFLLDFFLYESKRWFIGFELTEYEDNYSFVISLGAGGILLAYHK